MKQEGQVRCPVDILKGDHQLGEKNQSKVTPGVEEITKDHHFMIYSYCSGAIYFLFSFHSEL